MHHHIQRLCQTLNSKLPGECLEKALLDLAQNIQTGKWEGFEGEEREVIQVLEGFVAILPTPS